MSPPSSPATACSGASVRSRGNGPRHTSRTPHPKRALESGSLSSTRTSGAIPRNAEVKLWNGP